MSTNPHLPNITIEVETRYLLVSRINLQIKFKKFTPIRCGCDKNCMVRTIHSWVIRLLIHCARNTTLPHLSSGEFAGFTKRRAGLLISESSPIVVSIPLRYLTRYKLNIWHYTFFHQPASSRRSNRDDPHISPGPQGSGEHEREAGDHRAAWWYDVRQQNRSAQRRLFARELLLGAR